MKTAPARFLRFQNILDRGAIFARAGSVTTASAVPFVAAVALAVMLVVLPALAQSGPRITAVDPPMGKAEDTVTLTGASLGKSSVSAVLLSDDKNDYKATIVSQAEDKIVIKIPKVKAGGYNVSVQDAKSIMILPVRFTVEE